MLYTFFFFNDTATTEIYTLSLHDALPICEFLLWYRNEYNKYTDRPLIDADTASAGLLPAEDALEKKDRSEEHTSELQSHSDIVCRLLLEKTEVPLLVVTYLAPHDQIRAFS